MPDRTRSLRQARFQAKQKQHAERWRAVCDALGLDPDEGASVGALLNGRYVTGGVDSKGDTQALRNASDPLEVSPQTPLPKPPSHPSGVESVVPFHSNNIITTESNGGQPTLFPLSREARRANSWPGLASGIWAVYFGAVSAARMGKALKLAVEAGGAEAVLKGLQAYCEERQHDDPEYVSPEGYAKVWRKYAERVPTEEISRGAEVVRAEVTHARRIEAEARRERWRALKEGRDVE